MEYDNNFDEILKLALSEKILPPEKLNEIIVEKAKNDENILTVSKTDEKSVVFIIFLSVFFTALTGAVAFMLISMLAVKLVVMLMFILSVSGELLFLVLRNKEQRKRI